MKAGWVYILHFVEPLHHARHYAGSTRNIKARIERHRSGGAARLTRALMLEGIDFVVAVVLQSPDRRRDERKLKDKKATRFYCPLCARQPRRLPECIAIPEEVYQ